MRTSLAGAIAVLVAGAVPAAAVFVDSGQTNAEIQRTDAAIVAWATGVADSDRGPMDYQNPGLGDASFGAPANVLGPNGTPCSLGDGGTVTLTFDVAIANGPGPDLVVFENAFSFEGQTFMEIGFVEVSSDGVVFSRMPSICRRTTQPGAFDGSVSSDFYNLGGNHDGGTGIDLQDLIVAEDSNVVAGALDLSNVTHVRIRDVIGHIANGGASQDYFGTPVADPYPTAFASGGMDLTGVGVLNLGGKVGVTSATWSTLKSLYRN